MGKLHSRFNSWKNIVCTSKLEALMEAAPRKTQLCFHSFTFSIFILPLFTTCGKHISVIILSFSTFCKQTATPYFTFRTKTLISKNVHSTIVYIDKIVSLMRAFAFPLYVFFELNRRIQSWGWQEFEVMLFSFGLNGLAQ